MAPAVAVLKEAETIIRKVAQKAIGKRSRGGRLLESQRVKGLLKGGLDKLKKSEGVMKRVMFQLLARGAAHHRTCGFRLEFRPNCSCHIVEIATDQPEEEGAPQRNVKDETKSESS